MSRRKYLRPAQALAAALVSIAAGTAGAGVPSPTDSERIGRLQAAVESESPLGTSQLVLDRPAAAPGGERYAAHYSHRSHSSHASHRSHYSHYSGY